MAEDLLALLKEFFVAPHWYPLVPIIGFLVVAGASAGQTSTDFDEDEPSGAAAWPAPMALSLVVLAILCGFGKYSDTAVPLVAYTVAATICGVFAANRSKVRSWVNEGGVPRALLRDVIVLVAGIIATMMTLELSWNTTFPALTPAGLLIELGLIAGIILSLYFLGQRTASLVWIAILLAGLAGTCQYFLAKFKGVALLPSDLLAMPTAFKVKEGYAFVLDGRGLFGPGAACVAFALFSLMGRLPEPKTVISEVSYGRHSAHLVGVPEERGSRGGKLRKFLGTLLNFVLGVACTAATVAAIVLPNYIHQAGIKLDYGKTLDSYKANGFLTCFVAAAQDLPISAPTGYTRAKAADMQVKADETYAEKYETTDARKKSTAQFEAQQPSIVVVMNESFCDLSSLNGLGCGYEGPTYFKSIDDALRRGKLSVSVIGGGTCNTEFEFLTGNNYGFVGSGKYPYVTYSMRGENLASQLASLGYTTHAIHPNLATNWKRDEVYEQMGFDEFLDITAFEGADELHMGVTDAATYDKVIEILKVDPSPQFIFDVTMQNHGSYNLDNIPEDKQVSYVPEGLGDQVSEEDISALNEYLACIKASDEDLKAFMDELRQLDRRVVLVFFGDHQPPFTPLYNDALFPDEENELEHKERVYQSDYLIWANYDVAGIGQESAEGPASADMLGALTLHFIGAPLSSYQQARIVTRGGIRAANAFGYLDKDGAWHARDDAESPYAEQYELLAYLNHLNFGSKVS